MVLTGGSQALEEFHHGCPRVRFLRGTAPELDERIRLFRTCGENSRVSQGARGNLHLSFFRHSWKARARSGSVIRGRRRSSKASGPPGTTGGLALKGT